MTTEGKGLAEGARYGVIIGLFFGISQAYDSYVIYPIPYSLALKWFLSGLAYCVVRQSRRPAKQRRHDLQSIEGSPPDPIAFRRVLG